MSASVITALKVVRRIRFLNRHPVVQGIAKILLNDEKVATLMFNALPISSEQTKIDLVNFLQAEAQSKGLSILELLDDGSDNSLLGVVETILTSMRSYDEEVSKTR